MTKRGGLFEILNKIKARPGLYMSYPSGEHPTFVNFPSSPLPLLPKWAKGSQFKVPLPLA
jgi:hypothetical protein